MSRPNVLWICTDQQRYDTLGCYGNDWVETPTIDGLAARGMRFDRCYSQSPVCTPSRASFLTGRYPRTTRCRQNGQSIPESEVPVTKLLNDAGYTCGLAGKLHVSACNPDKTGGPPMSERRIDDGYDEFHWSHDANDLWPTNEYHHWLRRKGVEFERTPVRGSDYVTTSVPAEHHQTTWCVERAIDFLEATADADRPWLYSVNPFDPHHAFDPPRAYLERYLDRLEEVPLPDYDPGELDDKPIYQRRAHEEGAGPAGIPFPDADDEEHRLVRAAYWAMCDLIDDQVGRLLEALERTGQREDTIVIFTSDHGEMLGDHGIYLKGPYFYEPAVRVPLVVAGPKIESGVETDALVELSDLAPTLLEAAGRSPPDRMQARSLWPVLTGERDPDAHREDVYCEYYNALAWHDERDPPYGTMVRTDRYKLVAMHGTETGEFYDLEDDPSETENRWNDPEYAEVKTRLLERLADRMAETVDPIPQRQAPW